MCEDRAPSDGRNKSHNGHSYHIEYWRGQGFGETSMPKKLHLSYLHVTHGSLAGEVRKQAAYRIVVQVK